MLTRFLWKCLAEYLYAYDSICLQLDLICCFLLVPCSSSGCWVNCYFTLNDWILYNTNYIERVVLFNFEKKIRIHSLSSRIFWIRSIIFFVFCFIFDIVRKIHMQILRNWVLKGRYQARDSNCEADTQGQDLRSP